MNDEQREVLNLLANSPISEPLSGAIECLCEHGNLSPEAVAGIERFTRSPDIDNRYEALLALVHYARRMDLDAEAIGLLVAGLIRDDSDAYFGAISLLGMMAQGGNGAAKKIVAILSEDQVVREYLQLGPP